MHPQTLTVWLTTPIGRSPSSHFYSEYRLLSGTRTTSRTLVHEEMTKQISSFVFQIHETNVDTEWRWNLVSEKMEKKLGTFYTESKERLTRGSPRLGMVLRRPNKRQNRTPKHDKRDKNTSTFRCRDLNLDTYNWKNKKICWKTRVLRGLTSQPE